MASAISTHVSSEGTLAFAPLAATAVHCRVEGFRTKVWVLLMSPMSNRPSASIQHGASPTWARFPGVDICVQVLATGSYTSHLGDSSC